MADLQRNAWREHGTPVTKSAAVYRIEALIHRGDIQAATEAAETAMQTSPDNPAILDLLGKIKCHTGDVAQGAELLRQALTISPEQLGTRLALANALAMIGDATGAEEVCTGDAPELLRLRGYLLQSQQRLAEAADCYARVVELNGNDWEIWNNLGNVRQATGDMSGAIDALRHARQLRPEVAAIQLNLARALLADGRIEESIEPCAAAARLEPNNPVPSRELGKILMHLGRYAEAIGPLSSAARLLPDDADLLVELGRAFAGVYRLEEAEKAYRAALQRRPTDSAAMVELGIILERGNRLKEIASLLEDGEAKGVPAPDLFYLRALVLRDEGRQAEALAVAQAMSAEVQAGRRARLIGQLADGLGDTVTAFRAFKEANSIAKAEVRGADANAKSARERVAALLDLVTPEWFANWKPAVFSDRPSPVFLLGFPRSGTTLLDTVLMGHPAVTVLEEERTLQPAEDALGDYRRLANLAPHEIADLRRAYFDEIDRLVPNGDDKLVIDKLPLNVLRLPLIHRLFPDARILFAQRHPCDVVLSCFMQRFTLNDAMANFLNLDDAARFYDLVLTLWEKCCATFPLRVHSVRYEALVDDLEGQARAALKFLGLPWDASVLDYACTARARGIINTPSYSQVVKPIYRQASGRWRRYKAHMTTVLPILEPWALRLGYGGLE